MLVRWQDILPKDTLPNERFAERTFCRKDILPNGQFELKSLAYTVKVSVIKVIVDFDDRNFDNEV
jgi:hypothetical protein